MENLKRRFKGTIVGIIVVFGILFLGIKICELPALHVSENSITRNLNWLILPMPEAPVGRTVAWDSELPKFVEDDMEYSEEHGYEKIQYEFKGTLINLRYIEEEWRLDFETYDTYSSSDELTNFSIYQTKDHKIVVYGYGWLKDWFQKITLSKNNCERDTLTYDANLPLDMEIEESIASMNIDGYSIVCQEETFYFYREGQLVTYQEFPYGKIEKKDLYRGVLETDNKNLYAIYIGIEKELPKLHFVYAGKVDSICNMSYQQEPLRGTEDKTLAIPILSKDGRYYTLVPRKWDTYKAFSLQKANYNRRAKLEPFDSEKDYKVDLVEISENFKEAKFKYYTESRRTWNITLIFTFREENFYENYSFDGYDVNTALPETVYKRFTSKKVTSLDEMWETIDSIRKAYFDYYENRGDFVPAVPILIIYYGSIY